MPKARPAVAADIDAICDFLHARMTAEIPVEGWRRLMTYGWLSEKPDLGAVAVDGGRVVGYMGVVYADRQRQGHRFRTGNLTSWYLEKAYRATALGMELLRVATRHAGVVYTSFTSTAKAVPLLRLAGLRCLDDRRRLWRRRAGEPASDIAVVAGRESVSPLVGGEEHRLLADHAGLAVRPYAIRTERGTCLVLLSTHEKEGRLAHHEALHVGAADIFAPAAQAFADAILPAGPAALAVDRRFLADCSVDGEIQDIRVPRYFRPIPGVAAADVDNLYSEIELLDLKLW